MKNFTRPVFRGILNHCYQRTEEGVVIFYSMSDYLVFFTHFCVFARRHDVQVLSLCLMPDHIHHSTRAWDREALAGFVRDYSSHFSRVHNQTCRYGKRLFESPFGSAPKTGDKKARTNLIYVGNNPVERHLCTAAEKYRWNFIAYARKPNPFSAPLVIRRASYHLRKAVREVKDAAGHLKPLTYMQLQRISAPLSHDEREQLTDFIISTYNVLDYHSAIRFFGNYDNMILAMHATTGSEYDLNEVHSGKTDACYAKLSTIIMKKVGLNDIHDVFLLSERERYNLLLRLMGHTEATPEQLAAFLRVAPPRRREI